MRQVCGLDVHKDSVFVCILNENGIVFQEKYGVQTPELEQVLAKLMEFHVEEVCMYGKYEHLLNPCVESVGKLCQSQTGQSVLHQTASRKEE